MKNVGLWPLFCHNCNIGYAACAMWLHGMVGGMAEVRLTKNDNGELEIADYGVKPMISHVASGPEDVTTYFLEDYPEELAEENEIVSQDPEFSREYCVNLCDSVWGDLWKTE